MREGIWQTPLSTADFRAEGITHLRFVTEGDEAMHQAQQMKKTCLKAETGHCALASSKLSKQSQIFV